VYLNYLATKEIEANIEEQHGRQEVLIPEKNERLDKPHAHLGVQDRAVSTQ
jgi:hypothetical protein